MKDMAQMRFTFFFHLYDPHFCGLDEDNYVITMQQAVKELRNDGTTFYYLDFIKCKYRVIFKASAL
jgi:hypothetical protein